MMFARSLFIFISAAIAGLSQATDPTPSTSVECQFASHFYGGAVLQRNTEVAVWGNCSTAFNNIQVNVTWNGEVAGQANVDGQGNWQTRIAVGEAMWAAKLGVVVVTDRDADVDEIEDIGNTVAVEEVEVSNLCCCCC